MSPFVPYAPTNRSQRAAVIAAVTAIHVVLGCLLVAGVSPAPVRPATDPLQLFDIRPILPLPPEQPARKPAVDLRKTGAAAPADRDAKPTELVAPTLPPPLPPLPPPLPAAPVAGPGDAPASGAALVPGPGTGGGGVGAGTGSGGRGSGQGGGGTGAFARKISGRIYDRDYPRAAARAGIGGTVWVRYTVRTDGRADDCRVTRSSGDAGLDAVTCRLVTKRFRYRPGTDAGGRPIASTVEEDHVWVIEPDDGSSDERE